MGRAIEDGAQALSTDCATTRAVVCHGSPDNCSYAAKRCDPVPRALDRGSRTSDFALAGGGHAVEDSLGNLLGRTSGKSVHLNWGQRRTLHGTPKVLASDDAPYRDATGASLKVVASCGAGMNATDYLARNGRVNLIFNLPGYEDPPLGSGTMDVYPTAARLRFDRVEAQSSIGRPLFDCSTGTPRLTGKTLRFLYGSIAGAPARQGWIAEPDLAPGL